MTTHLPRAFARLRPSTRFLSTLPVGSRPISSSAPSRSQSSNPVRARSYSSSASTMASRVVAKTISASENDHNDLVNTISSRIRDFHTRRQPFRISHGSTNSTRPRKTSHQASNTINIAHLNQVLHVDPVRKIAHVEPNVPMDRLVEATLEYNLVPPVVMEFPGITVGGGYAGTSGESSSFKHGFFDRGINWVEMVLGDGSVVKCYADGDKKDLFDGAAGAMGTLGVTTLVELRLREAKRFVETRYIPVRSVQEAMWQMKKVVQDDQNDYVDGIMFSKEHGAVIVGRMTDELSSKDIPVQTFSRAWDPWFYMHVQENTDPSRTHVTVDSPHVEAIPLPEYLFRYDRAGFWVARMAFQYFNFTPFTRLTRWFLDDFLHTRMMYTALHASGESRKFVIQDLAMPYESVEEFVDYTSTEFGIWPLWLCPLKQSPKPSMHPHSQQDQNQMLMNVGLWGWGPTDFDEFVQKNRDLERKLAELDGMKWLYAHTYYSEDEFWRSFDRTWYDQLRQKYTATLLPNVYEKVRIDVEAQRKVMSETLLKRVLATWPFGGLYGLWKAIQSGSYTAARASTWKSWKKSR